MWSLKKKKAPESIDWLTAARSDIQKWIDKIEPELIELNQKYFKKDTGFTFISGKDGKLIVFTTEIEGLGMINEYFYKSLIMECLRYLRGINGTADDIIQICDALKKDLLKECRVKI